MIYVEKIRSYAQHMPLAQAVEMAVDECISIDVLKDFLISQKSKVVKMSIYEYDEEKELAIIKQAEREIGIEQGISNTLLHSIINIMNNLKVMALDAMRILNIPEEEWDKYLKMLEDLK